MTRKVTNQILEMIEDGYLDRDAVIMACLKYMSEDDLRDMAHANEFIVEDESLDDDTEEEEDKCESCETELSGNDVRLCASCADDAMDEDCLGDWYDTSKELQ